MNDSELPGLTDKQYEILEYLRTHTGTETYFKSRHIGEDLGLSAKEVGKNMARLIESQGEYPRLPVRDECSDLNGRNRGLNRRGMKPTK